MSMVSKIMSLGSILAPETPSRTEASQKHGVVHTTLSGEASVRFHHKQSNPYEQQAILPTYVDESNSNHLPGCRYPSPLPPLTFKNIVCANNPDVEDGLYQDWFSWLSEDSKSTSDTPENNNFTTSISFHDSGFADSSDLVESRPSNIASIRSNQGKFQHAPRRHVKSACFNCKRAHLSCDVRRPCTRCIQTGKTATCVDIPQRRKGRPRLRQDNFRKSEAKAVSKPLSVIDWVKSYHINNPVLHHQSDPPDQPPSDNLKDVVSHDHILKGATAESPRSHNEDTANPCTRNFGERDFQSQSDVSISPVCRIMYTLGKANDILRLSAVKLTDKEMSSRGLNTSRPDRPSANSRAIREDTRNGGGGDFSAFYHPAGSSFAGGKRHQPDDRDHEDTNKDMSNGRKKPKNTATSSEAEDLWLACPWHKHSPWVYCENRITDKKFKSCAGGFRGFRRLHEHIGRGRLHLAPIHCVRCYETFTDVVALREHSRRNSSCPVVPQRPWDGITDDTLIIIKKRLKPLKTDVEKWRAMYEIVFPGETVPSPFHEPTAMQDHCSRFVSDFVAFQETELPKRMRTSLGAISAALHAQLENALRTCLAEIYRDWLTQARLSSSQTSSTVQMTATRTWQGDERTELTPYQERHIVEQVQHPSWDELSCKPLREDNSRRTIMSSYNPTATVSHQNHRIAEYQAFVQSSNMESQELAPQLDLGVASRRNASQFFTLDNAARESQRRVDQFELDHPAASFNSELFAEQELYSTNSGEVTTNMDMNQFIMFRDHADLETDRRSWTRNLPRIPDLESPNANGSPCGRLSPGLPSIQTSALATSPNGDKGHHSQQQ